MVLMGEVDVRERRAEVNLTTLITYTCIGLRA